jgi:SRSO17 transposase
MSGSIGQGTRCPARRRRGYPVASGIPGFRTKPQLAVELVQGARQAGGFRAVVADCFYGDNPGCTDALGVAKVPLVLASSPQGAWAPADQAPSGPGGP